MNKMPITMLNGLGCQSCGGTCGQKPVSSVNGMRGLGAYGKIIAYNTEPQINNVPGIDRDGYFNCADWMSWHGKLVDAFKGGKFASGIKYAPADAIAKANEVFLTWWNKQNAISYTNVCYSGNTAFRTWWQASGLPVQSFQNIFTRTYDLVTDTQKKVYDTAGNLVDSAGNTITQAGKTASTLATVLKWVLPATVVGVVGLVGFYLYKNYAKGNARVKVGTQTI